jgi:hypothetical protein
MHSLLFLDKYFSRNRRFKIGHSVCHFLKVSRLFIANIEHYINFDWYKYKLELYNQIKYIKLKKAFEFSYYIELISWL